MKKQREQTTRRTFLVLALFTLLLQGAWHPAAADEIECDEGVQKQVFTAGGISGTAILCIGRSGVRASMKLDNVAEGHLFTVWFQYADGGTFGPGTFSNGRLASALSDRTKVRLSGDVGGLAVSPGSAVRLLVLDHGIPSMDNGDRALNVLAPLGTPIAVFVFTQ